MKDRNTNNMQNSSYKFEAVPQGCRDYHAGAECLSVIDDSEFEVSFSGIPTPSFSPVPEKLMRPKYR